MEPSRIPSCIDLPLSADVLEETVAKAKDYVLMHGISMHSKTAFNRDQVQIAPFCLLPSCFPKREYEKAKRIQKFLNDLMHEVAHNDEFLTEKLKSTVEADDFTAKLFDIYKIVQREEHFQPYSIGLLRSDYMVHGDGEMKIIQIELNTIASSFGGLAGEVSKYHRYILNELGHSDKIENIPENTPAAHLAKGLVEGWLLYGRDVAVILFVVEDITYNICDQRSLELEIRRLDSRVRVIRKTFKNLADENTQLGPNRELIVGEHLVSVVYYRTGYQSADYNGEADWSMRLLIEQSFAIKCPSIRYHLAGTKKIQQALAEAGALDQFQSSLNQSAAEALQDVFTGLYSLEFDEHGNKAVERAIADPTKYVLKPQREGGGNNIYGEDVRTALELMKDSKERTAWILMDRINPPVHKNYLIRAGMVGEPVLQDVVSELGIYGVVVSHGSEGANYNDYNVGHVLRTKPASSNEGGIVAGDGALDSPYIVERKHEQDQQWDVEDD